LPRAQKSFATPVEKKCKVFCGVYGRARSSLSGKRKHDVKKRAAEWRITSGSFLKESKICFNEESQNPQKSHLLGRGENSGKVFHGGVKRGEGELLWSTEEKSPGKETILKKPRSGRGRDTDVETLRWGKRLRGRKNKEPRKV